MIIDQTYNLLKSNYRTRLERLVIDDIRIGLHLTAVRLSDGSCGTSATLPESYPFTPKSHREYGDFTPLRIRGKSVTDLLESSKKSNIVLSLKNAILSAVSSDIIRCNNYNIRENTDPIELADLCNRKTIAIVGAFQSYIRKVSEAGNELFVLELNESALNPDQKQYFVPASEYKRILQLSDLVIITGQTLVNGTIDELLASVSENSQVIVSGPSSSILPDVLFENKVNIVGAIRITKPEVLFDVVSEGGTGYHLFEYCAQKISIINSHEA